MSMAPKKAFVNSRDGSDIIADVAVIIKFMPII